MHKKEQNKQIKTLKEATAVLNAFIAAGFILSAVAFFLTTTPNEAESSSVVRAIIAAMMVFQLINGIRLSRQVQEDKDAPNAVIAGAVFESIVLFALIGSAIDISIKPIFVLSAAVINAALNIRFIPRSPRQG